jgi:hypothetical protein
MVSRPPALDHVSLAQKQSMTLNSLSSLSQTNDSAVRGLGCRGIRGSLSSSMFDEAPLAPSAIPPRLGVFADDKRRMTGDSFSSVWGGLGLRSNGAVVMLLSSARRLETRVVAPSVRARASKRCVCGGLVFKPDAPMIRAPSPTRGPPYPMYRRRRSRAMKPMTNRRGFEREPEALRSQMLARELDAPLIRRPRPPAMSRTPLDDFARYRKIGPRRSSRAMASLWASVPSPCRAGE